LRPGHCTAHPLTPPAPIPLLQYATWQLGAPTLSMLYGLRLIASIIESKILLQYTIITKAIQVTVGMAGLAGDAQCGEMYC
jgi:hypothetical protein